MRVFTGLTILEKRLLWFNLLIAIHPTATVANTLDLEGFPDSTILGTQSPGVTFTNTIILSAGISLNEFEFPPHSGVNVVSHNGDRSPFISVRQLQVLADFFTHINPLLDSQLKIRPLVNQGTREGNE